MFSPWLRLCSTYPRRLVLTLVIVVQWCLLLRMLFRAGASFWPLERWAFCMPFAKLVTPSFFTR